MSNLASSSQVSMSLDPFSTPPASQSRLYAQFVSEHIGSLRIRIFSTTITTVRIGRHLRIRALGAPFFFCFFCSHQCGPVLLRKTGSSGTEHELQTTKLSKSASLPIFSTWFLIQSAEKNHQAISSGRREFGMIPRQIGFSANRPPLLTDLPWGMT